MERGERDSDGIKAKWFRGPWGWWLLLSRQRDMLPENWLKLRVYGTVFYLRVGRWEISLFRERKDD